MKKKYSAFIILLVSMLINTVAAQNNKPATDYLKVPGPIVFDGRNFQLSWSSHPSPAYYKQEYLVKGEPAERFKTMILLEVLTGAVDLKEIVGNKVAELKKMKEMNPMINYELMDNSKLGEYMLDFLVSANAADGKTIAILERNVYRYKTFTDASGKKGVLLFAVSERSYDAATTPFLAALKGNRNKLLQLVARFTIPTVSIAK